MTAGYWHGGVPGLRPGDLIQPPTVTGNSRALTLTAPARTAGDHARADRVYLTTDRAAAKAFAACYPDGALYRVEPVGEIDPDPDAPDASVRCLEARVVSVYDPCVLWRTRGVGWLTALRATRHQT